MYLSKLKYSQNYNVLNSLLLSKNIAYNNQANPKLNSIEIKIIFFDSFDLHKSQMLMFVLDFLEMMTGYKGLIHNTKVCLKNGSFTHCIVRLTRTNYHKFLLFLNDFILTNSLLRYSPKHSEYHVFKKIYYRYLFLILMLFLIYIQNDY